jgi:hypothetical protein
MRVTFQVARESHLLIVETRPDGAVVEIFPGRPTVLSRVPAGIAQTVPAAGLPPLPISGPEGHGRVRLIALPVGADPETLTASQLDRLQSELAVVEVAYEVVPVGS